MIKQVQASYNPAELEKRVRKFWEDTDAYKKTKDFRSTGVDFYFVDGPPYTTGSIHLGTAWNKAIKDTVVRYKRMQKCNVRDQPGYDMHGLPIEVKVESSMGIKDKKDIEQLGIDKFVSTCKNFALDFQKKMTDQFKELGVWLDWERPYMTINPSYMEAAWWTLKKAHDKGLLTSANRVISWCPRCQTALAEAEIEYWDEKDPSIYVKFPLKDEKGVSLLIWTTTPWTLPANMAVAAHPDYRYAKVRYHRNDEHDTVVLLESLVEAVGEIAGCDEYDVLELIEGDDLIGSEYLPPLRDEVPYQSSMEGKWVHRVIPSSTVEAANTGLVHIAPGHGPEDFELGKEYGLEPFNPVDEGGKFTKDGGSYAGMHVKKANPKVIEDLRNKGLMFHDHLIEHRYGHCWRCDSGIIYRTTTQWYLKITAVKDLMLDEIAKVRWTPDWAGSSREYDWTMNARDWCISRQRYWGIPIPIWLCRCGEIKVIGSTEELENAEGYRKDMDLHRPWIDGVVLKCDRCGGKMRRVPDILDVWFDAGVCSWAQLGYPKNRGDFEKWWPAKWICEAHDQTRGWFYSQLGTGCIAFGRAPYESVLMHGWMLDPQGQPMSKSRGNVIEPSKVVLDYGADALRFYFMRTNAPWEDIAFQFEGVKNARRTLNILWNVANFASTYMSIDKFDPSAVDLVSLRGALRTEDRWLVSRTEKLKNDVTRSLDAFELHKACRSLEDFIQEDLSRWYVRLIRDRMWKEDGSQDKIAAYKVLHESLMAVTKTLAPFCPHITEEIFQNLDGSRGSVHMCDWPIPDLTLIDDRLEASMGTVQEMVELVTKERQKRNVKLRWPLKRIVIKTNSKETGEMLKPLEEVLISQANVKLVEYTPFGQDWDELILDVIPNPHAIGKVYRQWSSKIAVLLKSRPAQDIKDSIEKGEYSLGIEGQIVKIEPNMVSFTTSLPKDIVEGKFTDGSVYIDFQMTTEIEEEGYARELIRRTQQMRKDMKLDVEEFISVEVRAPARLEEFFKAWKEHIMKETRALRLDFASEPQGEYMVEWDLEGDKVTIALTSLHLKERTGQFSSIPGISPETALALAKSKYSVEQLKTLDEQKMSEIGGISRADARNIAHFLQRKEATQPEPGQKAAKSDSALSKEKFVPYLLRVPRMNEVKAEMLYDAGFDAIEKLMTANVEELRKVKGIGAKTAQKIVEYAESGGFTKNIPCPSCSSQIPPFAITCPSCGKMVLDEGEGESEEEAPKPAKVKVQLEPSFAYLIKEEKSERAYALFEQALASGRKGICVTRDYPQKVKSKHNIGDTPVYWLSNIGKENALRPKDLEKLSFSMETFLSSQGGVILLDGLEYLITNNSFLTVLRFIQSLRDQVAINRSILLIAMNPSTLEEHELNLLEKEVDVAI